MTTNRHPVDQLADVRAEIKRLQAVEAELRDTLLEDGADLRGDEWYARVLRQKTSRLDRKQLEERFGAKAVANCCTDTPVTIIRLVRPESEAA